MSTELGMHTFADFFVSSRGAPLQFGTIGRPSSSSGNSFKSTPGHTYFTIDEEFDAIPLMCFLANTCAPALRKVVLFFDTLGCHNQYRDLVERVAGWWRVFVPENRQSNEDVASSFASFNGSAILILPFSLNTTPATLKDVTLGYCIYWGSTLGGFVPLLQAKKHRGSLTARTTSIIMTTEQASHIATILTGSGFGIHPSSADLLHGGDSAWLSSMRETTRSFLSNHSKLVREIYEAHLRSLGKNSRSLGAKAIASRVNKFTANVLLTGEAEDGSKEHPPIADRLATPLSIVNQFKLKAAVDAGLLNEMREEGLYA